jgi:SAM-dependent methyltransferase
MDPWLKAIILRYLPKSALKRMVPTWNTYATLTSLPARNAFNSCSSGNRWLSESDLDGLFDDYHEPEKYAFDPDSVSRRGIERANEILAVLPGHIHGAKSIELGALDARVSFSLLQHGFSPTAIDISDSLYTNEVISAGVDCRVMDAADLKFPDDSFDLAFSYNSFEHFSDPEKALSEIIRVVRHDGLVYLNFGPLYPSPMGLHGYESVPIPYSQFLFKRELLEDYCLKHNLGTIEFDSMNGWSASRFRTLFAACKPQLKFLRFVERKDIYGLSLIKKYPECFKGKVNTFDDLLISAIEALFQVVKNGRPAG